jgi:hypothetical protein
VLALLPGLAAADPHKVLVLQAEGRAEAGLRSRINTAIVRLATAAQLQASAGELTFTDAATAVGCRPDAPGCKDEVISMLSVDEIVLITVTPKPGGVEIAVQRIARGGAAHEATMLLATGAPADKLDHLASLFGAASAPPAGAKASPPSDRASPASPAIAASQPPAGRSGSGADRSVTTSASQPPAGRSGSGADRSVTTSASQPPAGRSSAGTDHSVTTSASQPPTGRSGPGADRAAPASPSPAAIAPAAPAEPPPVIPAPAAVAPASPAAPETAPPGPTALPADQPNPRDHRLQLAGMIGGGGLMVLGVVLWGAANSAQGDINSAPTRTSQDLAHLKDLESRGDLYAGAGNVLVAAGAVVGGIATYLYIRDRSAHAAPTARLVPTVLDHGAGLVLTLGGLP